jgi:hypothetical protein
MRTGDIFTDYEQGMQRPLEFLGPQHLHSSAAQTYQQRRLENLARSWQYGDTEEKHMTTENEITLDQALALARRLTPSDQLRLIARLAPQVAQALEQATPATPRTPLYGRFAAHGPAPSAETIDATRREIWTGFPREDV